VQQPVGHDVPSQTHCPLVLHSWPEGHAPHITPPAPQDELDSLVGSSHVSLAVQHPGHDSPAHVQAPFVHPSPTWHMPQAPPPMPHSVPDWAAMSTHVPSELQQPPEHEVGLQAHFPVLVSQVSPVGHPTQLSPPTPHCFPDCEAVAMHEPVLLQQPSGHVFGPQDGASPCGPSPAMERSAGPSGGEVSLEPSGEPHVKVSLQEPDDPHAERRVEAEASPRSAAAVERAKRQFKGSSR